MKKKIHILFTIFVIIIFIFSGQMFGEIYYIDQNHSNANDQNPGTIELPWKTITKANQTLTAGDTVYIKTGNYNSYIAPNNSGTATHPINYKNFDGHTITVSNVTNGIYLNGKSYIIVEGINFYYLDRFLWLQNGSNHNTIAYCNFDQGRNMGWNGSAIYRNSSYNWIHHCRFSKYGYYDTHAQGSVLDIGDEYSQTDYSNFNLIENNTMFHGGHHVLGIFGMYNVIRNNYFHNEAWFDDYGERVLYINGYASNSGWNVIEGNQIAFSDIPPANPGSSGMQLSNSNNIIRNNRFYFNNLSGIAMSATSNYISDIINNKIYSNTFFYNGWNPPDGSFCPDAMCSAIGLALYSGSWIIKYNAIKNNLYYKHPQPHGFYHVNSNDQVFAGNWDGDTQGDPKFFNVSEGLSDPMNSEYPDFHLQLNSPCIDRGTYLTRIITPNGSGVSFQVEDASYFVDGWGIVNGDSIQFQGSTQRVMITKVDYQSNKITIDRIVTWTNNQGLCRVFQGSAPDIGAFEFGTISKLLPPENLRFLK